MVSSGSILLRGASPHGAPSGETAEPEERGSFPYMDLGSFPVQGGHVYGFGFIPIYGFGFIGASPTALTLYGPVAIFVFEVIGDLPSAQCVGEVEHQRWHRRCPGPLSKRV